MPQLSQTGNCLQSHPRSLAWEEYIAVLEEEEAAWELLQTQRWARPKFQSNISSVYRSLAQSVKTREGQRYSRIQKSGSADQVVSLRQVTTEDFPLAAV